MQKVHKFRTFLNVYYMVIKHLSILYCAAVVAVARTGLEWWVRQRQEEARVVYVGTADRGTQLAIVDE